MGACSACSPLLVSQSSCKPFGVLLPFLVGGRPLQTFHSGEEAEPVIVVPILADGRKALVSVRNEVNHNQTKQNKIK